MPQNMSAPSSGPCSLISLKKRLLDLNEYHDAPFTIQEDGNDLVVICDYVDAKWENIYGVGGLKGRFQIKLLFDDVGKQVGYQEKSTSSEWEAGPEKIGFKKEFQLGRRKEFKLGGAWGLKKNGELGKVYSYDFESSSVTAPIFNVIKESGWRIKSTFYVGKKRSAKLKVFACLAFIAILTISILSFVFFMTTGVKEAARAEIDLLRENSYILAYAQTASEMREKITSEDFKLAMKSYNFENIEDYSFNNISVEGGRGVLSGSVKFNDGNVFDITIIMIQEESMWKMLSVDIG
ncbi:MULTISPECIES: hypothetical protein [Citrobacter]|jgi:hypothetical protein|uniref:Uncharacterized protein n=2 Tax=Citrobacter TaxID=544 RepID=A0A4P6WRZ0_9ENTR|nr:MULTISPECIES: hypothetical protein [Citrobacter]ARC43022.1 hypothetical protein A6J81_21155 [Citrobacter braakii]MDM3281242.1 hypothetical protein [Citrobacter sp. Ce104]MDM3317535.1 hypothetical protein [Citrobacter sp. Ce006]QBM24986.1 hypothetical protein E1B03_22150 [Citrobacter arsenatis]QLN88066.1 hypothetical protein HV119_03930 [Citrobacter freundii]